MIISMKQGMALDDVLQFCKEHPEGEKVAEQIDTLEKAFEYQLSQVRRK